MTRDEVEQIVDERLAALGPGMHSLQVYGGVSKKMIGDMVAEVLLVFPVVTIDGSKLRSVGGRRPRWLPKSGQPAQSERQG